jgi:dTMP kinase
VAPLLITFEGLDGSGKSTQLAAAGEYLRSRGRRPLATHEPGGTALGERLRAAFLDPDQRPGDGLVEALVVFASRRQHLIEVIEPALASGADVLCDRFTDSTLAYQGYGRGVALEVIEALDRLATGGRRPDLTLLYDLPAETARRRAARRQGGRADRLDGEALAFYERVRQGFLEIARRDPGRVKRVDATGDIEATSRLTRRFLDEACFVTAPRGGERVTGGRR